jgi:tetratricopeptide (TPR) repeat protein
MMPTLPLMIVLAWASAATAVPLAAQGRGGDPQSRALLEAATLESRGDLEGAEAALRRLLELEPTATGAVFALERVLRAKGEAHELRPVVDAFLSRVGDVEVRALKLTLLAEADSIQTMVAEAESWLESDPREPVFSAVAGVYERVLGPERALDVLRRGRARLGRVDALALQSGDVLAASGDLERAADEWALAVADDGSGMDALRSRLGALGADRAEVARRLVRTLGRSGRPERRRATLRLALESGLEEEALELARRHAGSLDGRARTTFLNEIGGLARESRMGTLAAWAYATLGEGAGGPEERRQFDQRIVDVALEAGDTVSALEAQRRVVASFTSRSDEWRRAQARSIELEATVDPERVEESWVSFRSDVPGAPELDAVAAVVAMRLQAAEDVEGAARVLEGIEGPRSTQERAYLLLATGDLTGGRAMLLRAVGGLAPAEATPVIQFASLLGRLSEAGKRALAAAGVAAHRGRPVEAAEQLAQAAAAGATADAAPLLAEAARLAERGGQDARAADIRRRLLAEHPEAPEVAEATLALARHASRSGTGEEEAIRMLEELITSRPTAAVVPEARIELQRLRSRGS